MDQFKPILENADRIRKVGRKQGFGQKGARSERIRSPHLPQFSRYRQYDDGQIIVRRVIAQPEQDIESIQSRHPQVQKHQDGIGKFRPVGKAILSLHITDLAVVSSTKKMIDKRHSVRVSVLTIDTFRANWEGSTSTGQLRGKGSVRDIDSFGADMMRKNQKEYPEPPPEG